MSLNSRFLDFPTSQLEEKKIFFLGHSKTMSESTTSESFDSRRLAEVIIGRRELELGMVNPRWLESGRVAVERQALESGVLVIGDWVYVGNFIVVDGQSSETTTRNQCRNQCRNQGVDHGRTQCQRQQHRNQCRNQCRNQGVDHG